MKLYTCNLPKKTQVTDIKICLLVVQIARTKQRTKQRTKHVPDIYSKSPFDTDISGVPLVSMLRTVHPNTGIFAKVRTVGEKQILARPNWNLKRTMCATRHFSEIIKQP